MRYALKGNKNGRSWESLVGYTLNNLKRHLEKQFKEDITWDNYGNKEKQWSIDHIIPISVFNFTKPEHIDFKRCWVLKNLKPMWHTGKKGNIAKYNKLEFCFQPFLLLS